jgi:hypothetical protein
MRVGAQNPYLIICPSMCVRSMMLARPRALAEDLRGPGYELTRFDKDTCTRAYHSIGLYGTPNL